MDKSKRKQTEAWIIAGLVFWFLETAYFGFNSTPSCNAERICDRIAVSLVWFGVIKLVVVYEIEKFWREK